MKKSELIKRYVLFMISLFFAGMGVAITKHAELGVSPISSIANILSIKFPVLSLGNWLIIWNCLLIVGQILILKRKFNMIQLLQIPLSFVFGYFTDFGMWCVSFIPLTNYLLRLTFVLIGVGVLGFGISLAVIADVVMNSGEAFVKALAYKTGKNFCNLKIAFDIICVIFSVALSFFFFGSIVGTREGTVLTALLTGMVVKFFTARLQSPLDKMLAHSNV